MTRLEQGREEVLTRLKEALQADPETIVPYDQSQILRKVECACHEAEALVTDLNAADEGFRDRAYYLLSQVTACRDRIQELERGKATVQELETQIRALLDELHSGSSM